MVKSIRWNIRTLPGMESFATTMMKKTIKNNGVAEIGSCARSASKPDVKLIGCQMTVDLFGLQARRVHPEVNDYVGAATFLPMAKDADVSLFI